MTLKNIPTPTNTQKEVVVNLTSINCRCIDLTINIGGSTDWSLPMHLSNEQIKKNATYRVGQSFYYTVGNVYYYCSCSVKVSNRILTITGSLYVNNNLNDDKITVDAWYE